MGIDRPDEDDEPTVERDSATAGRDTPTLDGDSPTVEHDASADSGVDRVAYTLKYRADVAAAYEAAWDEASPLLRQDWQEHEKRYPYPERSRPTVDPDGSWHAGDLELEPESNAKVGRGCERIREVGENAIVPRLRDVEAEDPGRHLVGFEHRFKEDDRLKEKVADQMLSKSGLSPIQALETIPDTVRFTFQHPHESYMAGVRKDIERLQAHGFIQVERRNTWTFDQYKGINSRWREPESGLLFEVQFHTRISFEAKELTHKAYERIRGKTEPDPELPELEAFQRRVCALIPLPPGATEYEDYPPEKRDG